VYRPPRAEARLLLGTQRLHLPGSGCESHAADQWELYSGADRDSGTVALNLAFESAVDKSLSYGEVSREVGKVMAQYREFGASDSEPIRLLDRIISEVFS
jgi:hypothetical protein